NGVGGHALLLRQFLALAAQGFPEVAVRGAGKATGGAGLFAGALGALLLAQPELFLAPEHRAGALRQVQAAVALGVDGQQAPGDQLAEDAPPGGGGYVLADAEGTELVVAEALDALVVLAGEHVDEVVDAEALAGAVHAGQGLLGGDGGVPGLG